MWNLSKHGGLTRDLQTWEFDVDGGSSWWSLGRGHGAIPSLMPPTASCQMCLTLTPVSWSTPDTFLLLLIIIIIIIIILRWHYCLDQRQLLSSILYWVFDHIDNVGNRAHWNKIIWSLCRSTFLLLCLTSSYFISIHLRSSWFIDVLWMTFVFLSFFLPIPVFWTMNLYLRNTYKQVGEEKIFLPATNRGTINSKTHDWWHCWAGALSPS